MIRVSTRRVVPVLAGVLLLSSCYRSDFGVKVNDDGSGQVDIIIAIDPERMQQLAEQFGEESDLGEDPCQEIRDDAESSTDLPEGATVEPYEEDGFCGAHLTAPFPAGTDIGQFIREELEFGSGTEESALVFETFEIVQEGDGWRFDATTADTADDSGFASGAVEGFLEGASNIVRIDLPGNVIEEDADRTEDGYLVWDLDLLGASRTMHARTGPGGGGGDGGGSAVLWIVLAAAAVVAVLVGVLLWRRSRSKAPPSPTPAPATVGGPPMDTSASMTGGGAPPTAGDAPPSVADAPPATGGPQWDPQRQAYIQWDPAGNRWMQYDDAAGEWKPLA